MSDNVHVQGSVVRVVPDQNDVENGNDFEPFQECSKCGEEVLGRAADHRCPESEDV